MERFLAWLSGLFSAARRNPKKTTGTATAGFLAACVAFIGPWEGRELRAYRDIVGVPTICYGHTGADVRMGDTATGAECDSFLAKDVTAHHARLMACIDDGIEARLPQPVEVALTSWAFNVGTGAACGSTLVRLLNAGDTRAACDQLLRWNKAGGKAVAGLTRRRSAERDLCLSGI